MTQEQLEALVLSLSKTVAVTARFSGETAMMLAKLNGACAERLPGFNDEEREKMRAAAEEFHGDAKEFTLKAEKLEQA